MESINGLVSPLKGFMKDSIYLPKKCHKLDRKEYLEVASRTALGFLVMGFVGLDFVKLLIRGIGMLANCFL